MDKVKIFVDSDVVISSLISSSGASYLLLHHQEIIPLISSFSLKEIRLVIERLAISKARFESLIKDRIKVIPIKTPLSKIKNQYKDFVSDTYDAHVVAGAVAAKTNFLISYNKKHFKLDQIKEKFQIIILTPGEFLQYLRSL